MPALEITSQHLDQHIVAEHEVHRFCAAASDLGLAPGEFPETIPTTLGNRQPFMRTSKKVADGDLIHVTYWQVLGCIRLEILND